MTHRIIRSMPTRAFRWSVATLLALVLARPAHADITAFLGSTPSPSSRAVKGLAFGAGLLIAGFEFEYASAQEQPEEARPGLRTGMGNVLLQTPFAIGGLQPYVTTGAGLYRERLGTATETNVVLNTGGGVKISLAGPVRLRLDYRVFSLKGDPTARTVHRVYAGVNLKL